MNPVIIAVCFIIIAVPLSGLSLTRAFILLRPFFANILLVLTTYVSIKNNKINWFLAIIFVVVAIIGIFFILYKPKPPIRSAECVPISTKRNVGEVVNVIDGDTIEVRLVGELTHRVPYIGMIHLRGDSYYYETAEKNAELVDRKKVTLVQDM